MFHRSARLLFRPGWPEDAPELAARIAERETADSHATVPWPCGEADARAWLSAPVTPRHPRFLLTLPGGRDSPVVGACGIRADRNGPELGYWIAHAWRGQGLATEAVRALLAIARALGHRRLHARHVPDNPAACRVLRKAGFRPNGRVPEYAVDLIAPASDDDPSDMRRAA